MIVRTKSCRITSEADPKNCPPKEVKNLGAAEPRYVLQSPGLVENCVGLYEPLSEFNHHWHREETLQIPMCIPVHNCHRIAPLYPQARETRGEHSDSLGELPIGEPILVGR